MSSYKVYVAGPMRGIKDFNFPAFDEASAYLRALGATVVNPADHDRENGFDGTGMTGHEDLSAHGFDVREALKWDLEQVSDSDAVAVLEGWENSSGAKAEVALAHALGVPVVPWRQFVHTVIPGGMHPFYHRDEILPTSKPSGNKREVEIVGLNGFARSGKDTAVQGLSAYGFKRFALADPIRESMLTLSPIMPSGRSFGDVVDLHGYDWDLVKKDPLDGPEARRLMQRFGTEVGRDLLGSNVWIEILTKRIAESGARRVAISDVRFDNEAEWVISQGGIVIEVVRPGVGPANGHASEKPLRRDLVTYTVHNDGTVQDLHRIVGSLVGKVTEWAA